MTRRHAFAAALIAVLATLGPAVTQAAQDFTAGGNYDVLPTPQRTSVPAGKVEVMEVFSYGCPACNLFQPTIAVLQKNLPARAQMVFLPAAFLPAEDWPVFQRAYFAAQALKIAERTHQAIFDAVWETGELATVDSDTHRLKDPPPTIEDVARVYERLTGTRAEVFLATARSAAVEDRMKAADAQIIAMQVPGTPTLVVNGRYRINMSSIRTQGDLIGLVGYLVAKDAPP
jgi:protein dithiol oxidoreductase (disulfide-forming)